MRLCEVGDGGHGEPEHDPMGSDARLAVKRYDMILRRANRHDESIKGAGLKSKHWLPADPTRINRMAITHDENMLH